MATIRIPPRTLPDIFYEDPENRWRITCYKQDRSTASPGCSTITTMAAPTCSSAPGGVMYNRRNGNDRIVPDCYIAFNVDVARI